MTSTNDTTILAVLSRYPDMPAEEADSYINRIEHEENIPVCHAVLGRTDPENLDPDASQTYHEFKRWADDRTNRTRNEQWDSRRRQKETRLSLHLNRLHEQGRVSDSLMLLYGISGDLPDRNAYGVMTSEEKAELWRARMESRFGPDWERLAQRTRNGFSRATFPWTSQPRRTIEANGIRWQVDGF